MTPLLIRLSCVKKALSNSIWLQQATLVGTCFPYHGAILQYYVVPVMVGIKHAFTMNFPFSLLPHFSLPFTWRWSLTLIQLSQITPSSCLLLNTMLHELLIVAYVLQTETTQGIPLSRCTCITIYHVKSDLFPIPYCEAHVWTKFLYAKNRKWVELSQKKYKLRWYLKVSALLETNFKAKTLTWTLHQSTFIGKSNLLLRNCGNSPSTFI